MRHGFHELNKWQARKIGCREAGQRGVCSRDGHVAVVGAIMALTLSTGARGQDYGLDFVTVGAAGNRAPTLAELPRYIPGDPIPQGVNYEYRLTRTEIVTSQWLEFVVAYSPYWTGAPNDPAFTGTYVLRTVDGQGYGIAAETALWPIDPSWEIAARYCNWLHNGKAADQWAFESGAYDTSTFTYNANGTSNYQLTRSAGARFWIPTYDEAIKAAFYDPNKNGVGIDGYWLYPNMSNLPPISGLPSEGGTTNAGLYPMIAGSYPDQVSPWGLLDVSGGVTELTETAFDPLGIRLRLRLWSNSGTPSEFIEQMDRLDRFWTPTSPSSGWGFRVASVVPSPSTAGLLSLWFLVHARRSRCTRS
jgi:hypothetical protein